MTVYDHIGLNRLKTYSIILLFPMLLLACVWTVYYWSVTETYNMFNDKAARFFGKVGIPLFKDLRDRPMEYWLYDGAIYVIAAVLIFCVIMLTISYFFGDSLLINFCAPTSRKITKQYHPELDSLVGSVAKTAGLPMPDVYVTSDWQLNSFSTGTGPNNASIILTEGLVQKLTKQELEAVVAHEMSHIGNRDTLLMTTITTFIYGIVLMAKLSPLARAKSARGFVTIVIGMMLLIYGIIVAPLIKLMLSRTRIYHADAQSVLLTRNPPALIKALEKIYQADSALPSMEYDKLISCICIAPAMNIPVGDFSAAILGWFETHPSLKDRVEALIEMDGNHIPEEPASLN